MKIISSFKGLLFSIFTGFTYFLILILMGFCIHVSPAFAHRPHDVVTQIELSPHYQQDQTVLTLARDNLLKSTDGGEHWHRVVKGLDSAGRFSDLKIASQNKAIVFLGTLEHGIYKSTDGGDSWAKVNNQLNDLAITHLAISPHTAEVVLASGSDRGLYRTQDGGQTWASVAVDRKVSAIAFSLTDPNQVWIGDDQGTLFVSNDAGKTWAEKTVLANAGAVSAIAFSPNFATDQAILIGTAQGGVFQSSNGGETFLAANQGMADPQILSLAFSPTYATDSTIFVATWHEGVFYSTNGGKRWTQQSEGLTKDLQAEEEGFEEPHFDDLGISTAFATDKTLFLGGFNGLFKTIDGGSQWQELETLSPRSIVALAVSPNYENDGTLAYVTYVGEVNISRDRGATWKSLNRGLEIPRLTRNFRKPDQDPRRFFDIAFSPNYASDRRLFVTLLWDHVVQSSNSGRNWQIVKLSGNGNRGLSIAASPHIAADETVYVASQRGNIHRSTNGGRQFSLIGSAGDRGNNDPIALVISPNFASDKTLFASGDGIQKSIDGGLSWVAMASDPLKSLNAVKLAISPNYAIDQTLLAGTEAGLFETRDGGETWSRVTGNVDIAESFVEGVALSPTYAIDRTYVVSLRGKGLFKTTDAGQSFAAIGDPAMPFARMDSVPSAGMPIVFSPAYATDQTLYGFTSAEGEIYQSIDGGQSWKTIAIPKQEDPIGDALAYVKVAFLLRPRLRFAGAAIAALIGYFLIGALRLDKKLPVPKTWLRFGSAFIVFGMVFGMLSF